MNAPTGINPDNECRRRIRNSFRSKNDGPGAVGVAAADTNQTWG